MTSPRKPLDRYLQMFALALVFSAAGTLIGRAGQGIVLPNTFHNDTAADADEVNANFNALATGALNRASGVMTGTITVRQVTPAATATYDLGTTGTRFRASYQSGDATIGGQLIVGSGPVTLTTTAGKLQGLSSTYLADLSGINLTTLNASNLASGTVATARLASGTANNTSYLRGDQTWATITTPDSVPANSVIFYDGTSCPSGYAELTSARGRYLLGMPSGGTLDGTSGTALTDLEARAAGVHGHTATVTMNAHNHTATDAGHTHSITDPGHVHNYRADDSSGGGSIFIVDGLGVVGNPLGSGGAIQSATTGISGTNSGTASISVGNTTDTGSVAVANSSGTAGTNAPYLQLLVCKKS